MTKRLKELILKIAGDGGKYVDGDIVDIFGKTYYVCEFNNEVFEIK